MAGGNLTELGAVPIALGVIGYGALVFVAGVTGFWAWIALLVLTLIAAVLVVWLLARRRRHPPAAAAPPTVARVGDGHRVLVIADGSCTVDVLARQVAARATEAFVVAPALASRLGRWTGDERAYADAEHNLAATLDALVALGIDARGHVGAHDPVQAADDGLREFPADELVFATNPEREENWLEEDVIDVARERYAIPVTRIVVTPTD